MKLSEIPSQFIVPRFGHHMKSMQVVAVLVEVMSKKQLKLHEAAADQLPTCITVATKFQEEIIALPGRGKNCDHYQPIDVQRFEVSLYHTYFSDIFNMRGSNATFMAVYCAAGCVMYATNTFHLIRSYWTLHS